MFGMRGMLESAAGAAAGMSIYHSVTNFFKEGAGGHVHATSAEEAKKHFQHHHIEPIRKALDELKKEEAKIKFNEHVQTANIIEDVGKTFKRFHQTHEGNDGEEHQKDYLSNLKNKVHALHAWVSANVVGHEEVLKKAHEIFEKEHKEHHEQHHEGGKRRRRKSRRGRKTHHKGGKKSKKSKKHHKKSKKHHKKSKKH